MIYLTILLILMQVFDFYSTYIILKNGGSELSPVVDFLIQKIGLVAALVVAKGVAVVGVLAIYYADALIAILILVAVYSYVCFNNYKAMRKT